MKALVDQFGTNQEIEKEGAWIWYDDDLAFKVKRCCVRNKKYTVAIQKAKRDLANHRITQKVADLELVKIFVDNNLVEWKGVTKGEGENEKPMKLTRANAIELFTNPKWPEFFDDLFLKAQDNEYFKEREDDAKN